MRTARLRIVPGGGGCVVSWSWGGGRCCVLVPGGRREVLWPGPRGEEGVVSWSRGGERGVVSWSGGGGCCDLVAHPHSWSWTDRCLWKHNLRYAGGKYSLGAKGIKNFGNHADIGMNLCVELLTTCLPLQTFCWRNFRRRVCSLSVNHISWPSKKNLMHHNQWVQS